MHIPARSNVWHALTHQGKAHIQPCGLLRLVVIEKWDKAKTEKVLIIDLGSLTGWTTEIQPGDTDVTFLKLQGFSCFRQE